jgi:hypothetical protein
VAGYLDQYGAGDERRARIVKSVVIWFVVVVAAAGALFFFFRNFREEQRVKDFFKDLASHDYKAAYALFGCTDAKPCRDYAFPQFMEDWGPNSGRSNTANFRISRSRSCGSGVILTVDFGKDQQEKLWVERKDMTVGFSPYPGCPN